MKDKRNYLKIACFIEMIYIICMVIYNLFFVKFNNEVMANLFMLSISLFFTIILYKESKKDFNYLKDNNMKILLCSIWMFFEPIVPGILGFFFLSSLKDKKQNKLPEVELKKPSKIEKIKGVIMLSFFILIMFVLPKIDGFKKFPSYFVYIFILMVVIILYHKELINNLKVFLKNIRIYFPFIIKRYFMMLGIMLIVAIPVVLINSGRVSGNQQVINTMFKKVPVVTLLLSCFYAPLTEETIFRLSLSKLFKNKTLFVIISGVLFGVLHVVNNITSFNELLYVLQYATLGICLAKAYSDSNNIFVSISMHFIQNFLAAILVLLVY